jgi:hypothetical protein
MRVPFVAGYSPPPENQRWYEERLLKATRAVPSRMVDEQIAREELALSGNRPKAQPVERKEETPSPSWSDILGKE